MPTALKRLNYESWPQHARTALEADEAEEFQRKPVAPTEFEAAIEDVNARLREQSFESLTMDEFYGGRLYTGPLYVKYNAVLRALTKVPFLVGKCQKLTQGNLYTTTIHVINSCILKLGRLMHPARVYRGMAGGMLPPEFFSTRGESGDVSGRKFLGVVEFGFMSTTVDKSVALDYASSGEASAIFEMQLGMIDRGADISWLSQ